ncbi:voltage-dependent calcium channel gamma-3 subunit isoform X2 [Onychostoma macrolepis]|uniref:Voltage-dependent calcium channel gamma-3 subunit n=5 Tax=Cypriniformes TaxID=7952 RepID=E7EY10_DANRE|nr:voltage-dependent calcium channel gamma-3 subunit [Pimephales promelas]XP_043091923.1 voltage-dependent calcium channel gamma-3 subunit [Puntigrus tetrazona]XP_048051246.1 voltage-dependent calcium channel gamma-3 subunit [Megalobrama amblycephala]XP_048051254.1 voltage-dependent calcium channel gamma-3 subunit [Megalobrama amblycephala]XP_050961821.1 voltage-dependent calcium channel gamma-3 subunit [Labeo rohita]XP_051744666.1 voltage-dependent calcium channel gamma-3 subunit [Ctenopharyn|eukprot:XP_693299.1 voltage-dependent calcium channel gamma-3 subunit [Danio rerio]
MLMCDRGVQMLITTVGAFAAFSLMTIAVGTDYWLYSRGVCRVKSNNENETSRKNEEVMTHSGLWRTCCLEGTFRGVCKKIDHFPEDADYEQDAAEYLLRAVRASSIFPIMSVGLLFMGGLCVAASEFYRSRHNVILSAGIFFVSAGLSNIIGIIVYISANSGDPGQSDSKKSYSYGWSFYFGALSFIMAEMVGVLAVHMFIEKHRKLRAKSRTELIKKSAFSRIPSYRYRFRRRSSCRSSEPASRDASPMGKSGYTGPAAADISMYTLSRDPSKAAMGALLNSEREFLQAHNSNAKDFKDAANRRTTPV